MVADWKAKGDLEVRNPKHERVNAGGRRDGIKIVDGNLWLWSVISQFPGNIDSYSALDLADNGDVPVGNLLRRPAIWSKIGYPIKQSNRGNRSHSAVIGVPYLVDGRRCLLRCINLRKDYASRAL